MASQFHSVFAFQANRSSANGCEEKLTFERLAENRRRGVQTDFLIDNNLLVNLDDVCGVAVSVSDAALREKKLYDWVSFLRECERRELDYSLTPGFGYAEMPPDLAKRRASRLGACLRGLGLKWPHDDRPDDYAGLGLTASRFDALNENQQHIMALTFASLLLMLAVKHLGREFSAIGKFRRYLREHKRLIGIVSSREIAIARYVFAEPEDCPGPVNEVRAAITKNFGKPKKGAETSLIAMEGAALNGAFDLAFLDAMNLVSTKGFGGRRVDPWLFTCDAKLSLLLNYCFTTDMGTGEKGLFSVVESHDDVSPYWQMTSQDLRAYGAQAAERVMQRLLLPPEEQERMVLERIGTFPRVARDVLAFAGTAIEQVD